MYSDFWVQYDTDHSVSLETLHPGSGAVTAFIRLYIRLDVKQLCNTEAARIMSNYFVSYMLWSISEVFSRVWYGNALEVKSDFYEWDRKAVLRSNRNAVIS